VAEVVERPVQANDATQAGREPAVGFYARLSQNFSTDIDLEVVVLEQRRAHPGIEL
jgi:hypothetical protein